MNNSQNPTPNTVEESTVKPIDLSIQTTKVVAIGRLTEKGMPTTDRISVMKREVPATVNLYLDGKIENWFAKIDGTGVVFIMNVSSAYEANELLEELPLGVAGMMEFDLIEVGPLSPLRFLL